MIGGICKSNKYTTFLSGRGNCIKGGGPRSIFTFSLFLIEENGSYQELFSEWKNIVPYQSCRNFNPQKYIQLHFVREL